MTQINPIVNSITGNYPGAYRNSRNNLGTRQMGPIGPGLGQGAEPVMLAIGPNGDLIAIGDDGMGWDDDDLAPDPGCGGMLPNPFGLPGPFGS